jgi:hypothetical protein
MSLQVLTMAITGLPTQSAGVVAHLHGARAVAEGAEVIGREPARAAQGLQGRAAAGGAREGACRNQGVANQQRAHLVCSTLHHANQTRGQPLGLEHLLQHAMHALRR